MYRMSSDIAPYVTHPDMPQFHGQVQESTAELDAFGRKAREHGLRLSFHPSQYMILNSPDPELNRKSVLDIDSQATILDRMGAGPEGVIIVHVGGVYGDKASAMDRWEASYKALPEASKRRLVLENDEFPIPPPMSSNSTAARGCRACSIRTISCCNNPERLDLGDTAAKFLATWPKGVRPKVHVLVAAHADARDSSARNRKTKKLETVAVPPLWTGHADYADPFAFIDLMRRYPAEAEFDIMLESKSKDLALRRLRNDLRVTRLKWRRGSAWQRSPCLRRWRKS